LILFRPYDKKSVIPNYFTITFKFIFMKKNSLPVVMSFIAEYLYGDKKLSAQMSKTQEDKSSELAELFALPLNKLCWSKIQSLCARLAEFTGNKKATGCFETFPDLFNFDDLARYYALNEDISRIPSRERLVQQWIKESGAPEKYLLSASVESKVITRCQAICLCEKSEELTGRIILADCRTPMQYLGAETTFGDIIDYFTVGSQKIDDIRYKIFKVSPENVQTYLNTFRNVVIRTYAMNCGLENPSDKELADFTDKFVYDCKLPDFSGPQDWDLPIWWTEDQLNIQISGKLGWVNEQTKVSEIIETFVNAKAKKMA